METEKTNSAVADSETVQIVTQPTKAKLHDAAKSTQDNAVKRQSADVIASDQSSILAIMPANL